MINPQALETFGRYDKKSLMAGVVVGQGLKGRARAPQTPAPAGFPQGLWDDAVQRANNMIASMQGAGQSAATPTEETPDDWQFDKDAFCFGIAAGRSLEGWEIDGFASPDNPEIPEEIPDEIPVPDGWALVMYYVHLDSPDTVNVTFYLNFAGEIINIDWGDGSPLGINTASSAGRKAYSHAFQSGDYVITCISNGGMYPACRYSSYDYGYGGVYGSTNFDLSLLRSACFEGNVQSIGIYAFSRCRNLTSVTIPDSVTSIGNSAFENCSGLTEVTIPSGSRVGEQAFARCTSLANVTICDGDSITQVERRAFRECTSLPHITIPGNVKSIEAGTFARCTSLANVTICDGVTRINGYGRTSTIIDEQNRYEMIEVDLKEYKESGAFSFCSALTSVTIPESVVYIGGCTFLECTALTSVTIPSGVTDIAYGTFYKCTALTSVTIPSGVTSIGSIAFKYCGALENVTIPDSMVNIWNEAFWGCSSFTSVAIPNDVEMGYSVFSRCSSLKSITIGANAYFHSSTNTSLGYGLGGQFNQCSSLTNVIFHGSIPHIAANMFSSCTALSSVTIPNGITSIYAYAFRNCTALSSVTIPVSVAYIGLEAFRFTSLTSVTISRNCYVFNHTYGAFPSNCEINYYD